jgi:hypothetical protein
MAILILTTRAMRILTVSNFEEHETSLARLEELMLLNPVVGSPEAQELDTLANAIKVFEKRVFPRE